MSEFRPYARRAFEFGAVGTAILALAACGGGNKPKFSGEFKDGVRTQIFHTPGGSRVLTEIIQECVGTTFIENTTDIGYHMKNGKRIYDLNTHFNSFDNSPYCEDQKFTPDDLDRSKSPVPTIATTPNI